MCLIHYFLTGMWILPIEISMFENYKHKPLNAIFFSIFFSFLIVLLKLLTVQSWISYGKEINIDWDLKKRHTSSCCFFLCSVDFILVFNFYIYLICYVYVIYVERFYFHVYFIVSSEFSNFLFIILNHFILIIRVKFYIIK